MECANLGGLQLLWLAGSRINLIHVPLLYCIAVILQCIIFRMSIAVDCWTRTWRARRTASRQIVIDSGASVHICYDRSRLINYRRYRVPRKVAGIGGAEWALGTGSLEIDAILSDGSTHYLLVPKVDYVPACGITLLSTQMLRTEGIYYCSERQILYRKHGHRDQVVGVVDNLCGGTINDAGSPVLRIAAEVDDSTLSGTLEHYAELVIEDPDDVIADLKDTISAQERELASLRTVRNSMA